MPNLVVYVPMDVWRVLEAAEGQAAKKVARSIANRALEQYVLTGSAPVGSITPLSPPIAMEPSALTAAAEGTGADEPGDEE